MMVASGAAAKGWSPRRCKTCGAPITPHEHVTGGLCAASSCRGAERDAAHAAVQKRIDERDRADRAEALALASPRVHAAIAFLGGAPDQALVADTPRTEAPLEAPDAERRAAFMRHLAEIVAKAFEGPPEPEDPVAAPARKRGEMAENAAMSAACATCRGRCCMLGAPSHAFLTRADVHRRRRRAPDDGPDEIVALYLAHLPERSVRNSCVYHGPLGCTLPRDLRAQICNSFHCREASALDEALRRQPRRRVVLVARQGAEPRAVSALDLLKAQRDGLGAENFTVLWSAAQPDGAAASTAAGDSG